MIKNSGPRVLVTGASGFIGRALVDDLRKLGYRVTAASRRAINMPPDVRVVQLYPEHQQQDWRIILREVQYVVHCAARVHVMKDPAPDPLQIYREVNVQNTVKLARYAAKHGVQRFVFLSSTKAVREQTEIGKPITRLDSPTPTDPYGISKYEAEVALQRIASETQMSVTAIRPPLVYGPGVGANFAAIARWVARGVPLPFAGLTSNRRSIVSRDNLLSLIVRCLQHSNTPSGAIFVSDGEDLSTASLVHRIAKSMERTAHLFPVPSAALHFALHIIGRGHIWNRLASSLQVDMQYTCDALGWYPPISLDEGLRRYAASLKSQRPTNT